MAIRQYIGARYTIKIYENSLNPSTADWESGVFYERLTMVNYNNSSYISKQDVPANIGDPASNPTYWVISGAYNGQIAQLQQDINDINTLIGDSNDIANDTLIEAIGNANGSIANKKFLFVGDSYNDDTAFSFPVWGEVLVSIFGLSASQYQSYGTSGGGFRVAGNLGTFKQILESVTADRDTYTDIIFQGGSNETYGGGTAADIETSMADCLSYAKANFPNAKLHVSMIGWSKAANDGARFRTAREAYKTCYKYGARYIENSEYIAHNYANFYDTGHPDQAGQEDIGRFLAEYLLNGEAHVHFKKVITLTLNTGYTLGSQAGNAATMIQEINDGIGSASFTCGTLGNPVNAVNLVLPTPMAGSRNAEMTPFATINVEDSLLQPEYQVGTENSMDSGFDVIVTDSVDGDVMAVKTMLAGIIRVCPIRNLTSVTAMQFAPHKVFYDPMYC